MATKRYTPLAGPISAEDAEQEPNASRAFQEENLPADLGRPVPPAVAAAATGMPPAPVERPYPRRQYTIDAVSPLGFPVHLTFADIKLTDLAEHIAALAKLGYTPPTQASAAPVATPDDLPEGWKLCQKHGAPMRPRNKQNQTWHSHNVGTREHPVYCKGYKGADSPGYDVE